MSFDLPDDYVDVATRITEFRAKFPEGSLQQHALDFRSFGGKDWAIYTAAAYRTPDDPRPGMGTAWEPVPGRTPFTRDSELQNAETAAWGRAIVAVLAADTKRGLASANEVRNRMADRSAQPDLNAEKRRVWAAAQGDTDEAKKQWIAAAFEARGTNPNNPADVKALADELEAA